jgi:hypothetical protein
VNKFEFGIHGIGVEIRGPEGELLSALQRDFSAFEKTGGARIRIDIVDSTPWQAAGRRGLGLVCKRPKVTVRGWFNRRVNVYGSVVAESVTENGSRRMWISGGDDSLMREVIYKFVLSSLGEELELAGYHRIHGFGFEWNGRRFAVLGRSGVGKSSLAAELCLRRETHLLFSDESPLVRGNEISKFPARLSIDARAARSLGIDGGELLRRQNVVDKMLLPFPPRAGRTGKLDGIFLAQAGSMPSIERGSRLRTAARFVGLAVSGVGLAQMAEWMLRIEALPRLTEIFMRRVWTFTKVALRNPPRKIQLSRDPLANVSFLNEILIYSPPGVSLSSQKSVFLKKS